MIREARNGSEAGDDSQAVKSFGERNDLWAKKMIRQPEDIVYVAANHLEISEWFGEWQMIIQNWFVAHQTARAAKHGFSTLANKPAQTFTSQFHLLLDTLCYQ